MNRNDFFHLPLVINRWQSTPRTQMRLPQFRLQRLAPSEMSQLRLLGQEQAGQGKSRCFTLSPGLGPSRSSLFLSSLSGPPQWAALPHAFCEGHAVKDIAGGADVGKEAVGSCRRLFWGQDASPRGSAHWPWGSSCPSLAPDAVRTLSLWVSQVLGLLEMPPSGSSHLRARPSPSSVCSPDTRGHVSGETPSSMPAVRALDELDLGTSVMSTTFSLEQASHPHLCPPRGPPADCGWWEGLRGKSSGHGESYLASDLHFFLRKIYHWPPPLSCLTVPAPTPLQVQIPRRQEHPRRLVPSCRAFRPGSSGTTPSPVAASTPQHLAELPASGKCCVFSGFRPAPLLTAGALPVLLTSFCDSDSPIDVFAHRLCLEPQAETVPASSVPGAEPGTWGPRGPPRPPLTPRTSHQDS